MRHGSTVFRALALSAAVTVSPACSEGHNGETYLAQDSCEPGHVQCGDDCVALAYDLQHCGSCYNACGIGQVCSDGTCVAAASALGGRPAQGSGGSLTGGAAAGVTGGTGGQPLQGSGAILSTGGSGGAGGLSTGGNGAEATGGTQAVTELPLFSFFVTSLEAMRRLSGSPDGFGGDLRYGEADGLTGADRICTEIAEASMPGAGQKVWRAFLSATAGPDGQPMNAIDRVGEGPWYDRLGRLVAMTREDLRNVRPNGADSAIVDDLPNEYGVPNSNPDGRGEVDNHDTLTGSDEQGRLASNNRGDTCNDWTSAEGSTGEPYIGHSWPARSGEHWICVDHRAHGCAPGVNLTQDGSGEGDCVGCGGGYGGFYGFALTP